MLTVPSMMYCHSSAVGCQCSSRSAPGSRSRIAPVIVLEIAKLWESTGHSRPPLLSTTGALGEEPPLVGLRRQFLPLERRRRFLRGHRAAGEVHLFRRKPVECRLGDAEVFGQERLGGVADPVGDAEGAELREVAVIEDQDEVRRLVAQAFELVTVAAREIPHVARLEVVRLRIPLRVDDRRPGPSLDHERPLGRGGVPVKLAHDARLETH